MNQTSTILVVILGLPLTALLLYLLARLVAAGWYKSKKDFTEWYFENVRKPVQGERRKSDRRQGEVDGTF